MPKGRIWITRSSLRAAKSAAKYEALGYETVVAPLIILAPMEECPAPPPLNSQLIITSHNGVEALTNLTERRHWPVITSGEATARFAKTKGFVNVRSAGGNASDIKAFIRREFLTHEARLVHLGSAQARGEISQTLKSEGYKVSHTPLYQARAIWPEVDLRRLSHIVFYSPMAASIFAAHCPANMPNLISVSISSAVDEALGVIKFRNRLIATRAEESAILAALGT